METLTRDYYAFNNPLTVPGCGEPASFYFRFHIEKPIVRSGFPHGIKRWLPTPSIMRKAQASQVTFNEAIKELQRQRIWTTSAQQAVRDATSIITRSHTLADHKETAKEQSAPFEVATILCQDETNDNSDTEKKKDKGDEEEEEEGVEEKQKEKNNKSDDDSGGDANVEQSSHNIGQTINDATTRLGMIKEETYTRHIPGFGGHIPRYPQPDRPAGYLAQSICSVSRYTYRKFPPLEYCNFKLNSSKAGALTQSVTLTYPHNPFKRIQKSLR